MYRNTGPLSDRNVLGGELEPRGNDPLTGFYRDGCGHTGPEDRAATPFVTAPFLERNHVKRPFVRTALPACSGRCRDR